MFKIFRKPESYGKTKLDHVLTYISYALRDACVTVGIVALMYMFFYFVNQYVTMWIWNTFIKQEASDETMDQVFKRYLSSRRADRYKRRNQNLFSCSNAISAYCGNFARLSTDQRSFLGIKITL